MKCPKCNVALLITERQGIEIDYCPECRGVWLDRGELDKIIERTNSEFGSRKKDHDDDDDRRDFDRRDDRREHHHGGQSHGQHGQYGQRPHKKKSFFDDLFDFD